MVKKDFGKWISAKEKIHNKKQGVFFHEREIWFCSLGLNVGFEQDGKGNDFLRPVVVFKKFNNDIFLGIPLTKKDKNGKYYFDFYLNKKLKSVAILSQIRLIDSKRLLYRRKEVISKTDFEKMKKGLKKLIF
ncbi:MAG: type II toxin-antitoxin system PemK/MazF family toxin [Candidatus Pacebacteria bacterium]|nr:type II toxin-antitoxin system PemK/MazF family toxin [Candidatus Paceibacterota bacterium]